jgi:hypothetical protein
MAYEWKKNMACVSTYNLLEGDMFLNQFDAKDIQFDQAANVELGSLRYFPKTTANPNIIRVMSIEYASKFLTHMVRTYTVDKQDIADNPGKIVMKIAATLATPNKTIKDLAEIVDSKILFPDES